MPRNSQVRVFSIAIPTLILILIVGLLIGCAFELPYTAKYFKYTIEVMLYGRPYSFSENIECVRIPADPRSQTGVEWKSIGEGIVATKLDSNHILFFKADSNCYKPAPYDLDQPVEILETTGSVVKLAVIHGAAQAPLVKIKRIYVEPVDIRPDNLGPSNEQIALTKAVLSANKENFQSVAARIIPYNVWATSAQSRKYFSQFSSVAIAKVGEAKLLWGKSEEFVQFPFYLERKYKRTKDGAVTVLPLKFQADRQITGRDFIQQYKFLTEHRIIFSCFIRQREWKIELMPELITKVLLLT
jgi:hypothetical protein